MDTARAHKREIPEFDESGVPIEDEIEIEFLLYLRPLVARRGARAP